jgi:hypothetical protein
VEDVKAGEHMAFFGVSGSGWSNDGLGLAWLQQVFERFTAPKARRKYRLDGVLCRLLSEPIWA